jgi:hypothetical protein
MRHQRSTVLVLASALMLALPALGWSRHRVVEDTDTDQAPAAQPSATQWGVGAAYLPGPAGPLDALTGTLKPNPDFALDGLLLAGTGSVDNGGTDSAGNEVNDSVGSFGLGVQGRYDVLHPTDFLAFQLVGRLSYVDVGDTHTVAGHATSPSQSQFGIFAGAGFEGYIPSWRSVSLEANSGLNIAFTGMSGGGSNDSINLGGGTGATFFPFNIAVHYYF